MNITHDQQEFSQEQEKELLKEIENINQQIKQQKNFNGNLQLQKGQIYSELKYYDQAMSCYQLILEKKNNEIDNQILLETLLNMVQLHIVQNKYDKALKFIEKAQKIDQNDVQLLLKKGEIYRKQGNLDKALECRNSILQINQAQILNNMAIDLDQQNQSEEAIMKFDEAIQLNPNDYVIPLNKGIALKRSEQYEKALSSFKISLQLNPKDKNVLLNLAQIHWILKNFYAADYYFSQAIEIDQNDYTLFYERGNFLIENNRISEGIQNYMKCISINPRFGFVYDKFGLVLVQQNKLEESLEFFQKAIQNNPEEIQFYLNKWRTMQKLYKTEDCLQILEKYIQMNGEQSYMGYYQIAEYFYNEKRNPKFAIENYKKALENTNISQDIRLDCLIKMGRLWIELKKYKNAMNCYDEVLEIFNGTSVMALLKKAEILEKLGNLDESLLYFDMAIEQTEDNILVQFLKAKLLLKKQKREEALEILETSLQKYQELHQQNSLKEQNVSRRIIDSLQKICKIQLSKEKFANNHQKLIERQGKLLVKLLELLESLITKEFQLNNIESLESESQCFVNDIEQILKISNQKLLIQKMKQSTNRLCNDLNEIKKQLNQNQVKRTSKTIFKQHPQPFLIS